MCTVVFIPGVDQCCFASLRDEDIERPRAIPPEWNTEGSRSFLAPKDGLAGGTWLGINEMQHVIILLNGAFTIHTAAKQYRKSRGKVVVDLLVSDSPVNDWYLMDLNGIEPFTLVVWAEGKLDQLVWDGENKKQIRLDVGSSHIWSSSTLYNAAAKARREKLFTQWTATEPVISRESLLSFFLADTDTENGFIINRNEKLKTLSYSFITIGKGHSGYFQYYDLIQNRNFSKEIKLTGSKARLPFME